MADLHRWQAAVLQFEACSLGLPRQDKKSLGEKKEEIFYTHVLSMYYVTERERERCPCEYANTLAIPDDTVATCCVLVHFTKLLDFLTGQSCAIKMSQSYVTSICH